ncbi:MAG: IS1182 family transposase [Armatimonadota bacterium]
MPHEEHCPTQEVFDHPETSRVVPDPPDPGVPRVQSVNRAQLQFRMVDVEALIPEDHPGRAIWAFVGTLDLRPFTEQIRAVEGHAGRPPYDPRLLVSLWIYSYSQGVTSARAIERLCAYDPAYQWLTGLEGISAHTLSDFRVTHGDALRELFIQVLGLLSGAGLITLERVMQDGTRIRAAAASKRFRRKARIREALREARAHVEALEAMPEDEGSQRQQRARERARREKVERLEAALKEFETLAAAKSTVQRVSTTDPDARVMKQAEGGSAPSYNVQLSTDAAHKLIVAVDVTQAGSDYQQLLPGLDRVEHSVGRPPAQVVVDGGYLSSDNIVEMAARGVELIGPTPTNDAARASRTTSYHQRGVSPAYAASEFIYDAASDTYLCPQGKRLRYDAWYVRDGTRRVRYKAQATDCQACPAKRFCCPRNREGRSIERREYLAPVQAFREKMQTDAARAIYRQRAQVAEFPNLWIKAKLGVRQFRVRGLRKVRLEALWAVLTYNIQQWIRLYWRPKIATGRAAV